MKKNLILFFAVAMGFASCGGDDNQTPNPKKEGVRLTKIITTEVSNNEKKEVDTITLEYGENGYVNTMNNNYLYL